MAKEKIDLSLIAYWIASDLKALEPSRNIKFIIPKNIMANGDSRLLMIAMTNLMNNAYKFTSLNTDTIIEFGYFKETYFVRDNGVGFEMRHVGKLFAPFQRLHGTNHFPGSGIGLATVKRIIQRHSGTIWAEAEVNKGATFYFTL
jgi:signal transduction histidine kinase